MEPIIQVNKFEIVDLQGMNTIGFVVEKNKSPITEYDSTFTLEKLNHVASEKEGKMIKTFNVITEDLQEDQAIILLTLTNKKAILSTGNLNAEGFKVTEGNIPLYYGTILNTEGVEYKEVAYNPSMKRHFTIIDTQNGDEVKPSIFIDPVTNEMKGRCKILPHRTYVVLEIKSV